MVSVVNAIKNDLVEAGTSGADLTSINADIANQQSLLNTMSDGATFNGQNWLNGITTTSARHNWWPTRMYERHGAILRHRPSQRRAPSSLRTGTTGGAPAS